MRIVFRTVVWMSESSLAKSSMLTLCKTAAVAISVYDLGNNDESSRCRRFKIDKHYSYSIRIESASSACVALSRCNRYCSLCVRVMLARAREVYSPP